jgi:hypothetical protein
MGAARLDQQNNKSTTFQIQQISMPVRLKPWPGLNNPPPPHHLKTRLYRQLGAIELQLEVATHWENTWKFIPVKTLALELFTDVIHVEGKLFMLFFS